MLSWLIFLKRLEERIPLQLAAMHVSAAAPIITAKCIESSFSKE